MPTSFTKKHKKKTALILVDLQNDFLPGGALGVKDGNKIMPAIRALEEKNFDRIVASKDWHPRHHGSFASAHGKKVGEVVDLYGLPQILWPDHCVQESQGADFGGDWNPGKLDKIIPKGTNPKIDSYSAFFDNGHTQSTGLEEYLRKEGIETIYLAGLTTEYCVKFSALDALKLGFEVYIVEDACKAVNLKRGEHERAIQEMHAAGAHITRAADVSL